MSVASRVADWEYSVAVRKATKDHPLPPPDEWIPKRERQIFVRQLLLIFLTWPAFSLFLLL